MSAEHEKQLQDPGGGGGGGALKRPPPPPPPPPRGGDGGLDGLGVPGVQLGSPDKKKRKSNAQGSPFPPPSEYAPPLNPSSDHLVAANPFDDNYHTLPYKPLPPGNPYFANPSYPGLGGYNTFRMPPHLLPRMSSPYGATYPLRSQPHPFPQNPVGMVFNRPQAMNFGPHDNVAFGNQPPYSANVNPNIGMPSPHFRSNPGENFGHIPSQNTTQMVHHELPLHFGPGNHPNFLSSQMEPSHSYVSLPNSYNQAKPSQKQGGAKPTPPPPQHGTEDIVSLGNADGKAGAQKIPANQENSPSKNVENLNSSHANGTPNEPHLPREGGGSEKAGKTPLHPSQHGHASSEPVYPCGICTHEVKDDQDAILCEASCQKWFHRVCTGMTESAYGLLTAEASAVWGCDSCMADKDVQLMRTRDPVVLNADA
ncbi:pygopus homolog 1 [Hemicordylus capensis]|uniref:pygopus homolog 1 n=1 Tax=Hemicordylus capensis TaxID=884348 RepID=UPI00230495BC|nr:pygopus homolog 1 [Hemicordylus capensis]XP_053127808.1 pygopus homolog 1 [Hemicordylus capensis]